MFQISSGLTKIIQQIEDNNIEVVSFDIFDTLLYRPCVSPSDIFKIVEYRLAELEYEIPFREIRIDSERRTRKIFEELEEINFDEIYITMQSIYGYDSSLIGLFKKLELEIEKKYLSTRDSGLYLLNKALNLNKRVILISDMYLSKNFIKDVLEECNIRYAELYVSSEYRKTKSSSNLFHEVLKKEKLNKMHSHKMLHIGDNYKSDVLIPKNLNIQSCHLPNAVDRMKKVSGLFPLFEDINIKQNDNSFIVGYLANVLFADPFIGFRNDSIFGGKSDKLGFLFLGPFLFMFMKWVLDRHSKMKSEILFILRDGLLPKIVFEIIEKYYKSNMIAKEAHYSRRMRYSENISKKNGFIKSQFELGFPAKLSVDCFVNERLIFDNESQKNELVEKILERDRYGNVHSNFDLFVKYYTPEQKASVNHQSHISRYIDNLDISEKTVIFDIGYRGSVARHIQKHRNINVSQVQLFEYSSWNNSYLEEVEVDSFITLDTYQWKKLPLTQLMEIFISSEEKSVLSIDEHLNEVRDDVEHSEITKVIVNSVQTSAIEFCKGFTELFKEDIKPLFFDKLSFFNIFLNFLKSPSKVDFKILEDLNFWESKFVVGKKIEEHPTLKQWKRNFSLEINNRNEKLNNAIGLKETYFLFLNELKNRTPILGKLLEKFSRVLYKSIHFISWR